MNRADKTSYHGVTDDDWKINVYGSIINQEKQAHEIPVLESQRA